MSDTYELEIKATNSRGQSATYHAEYTSREGYGYPSEGNAPDAAVKEIVQSIHPTTATRIKTVSRSH